MELGGKTLEKAAHLAPVIDGSSLLLFLELQWMEESEFLFIHLDLFVERTSRR